MLNNTAASNIENASGLLNYVKLDLGIIQNYKLLIKMQIKLKK